MPNLSESILQSASLPESILQVLRVLPLPGLGNEVGTDESIMAVERMIKTEGKRLPLSCLAGLWLLVGDLDRSHRISQDLHDANGSYWHGIMHRREGDYWNAKYWFRRVDNSLVLEAVGKILSTLAKADQPEYLEFVDRHERLDPMALTDEIEKSLRGHGSKPIDRHRYGVLSQVSWLEWQCLFAECAQTD